MCTCGNPKPHTIAHRTTADGIVVQLWDDGAITGAFGVGLRGVPMRRPTTADGQHRARVAGRLLLGEACIWDAADLGELYRACEKAARLDGMPGTVRRMVREARAKAAIPTLRWTVTSTDRNGRATERQARLPRLSHPGMAVIDYCGGPGAARGRYVLVSVGGPHGDTAFATGLAFRNLRDLWAHLRSSTALRPE